MKKFVSMMLAGCMLMGTVSTVGAAEEEPTVITWLHESYDVTGLDHWYDALWVKELEKRMNVKFEFISVNSSDNYDNIVNLTLSGDKWPDIISWDWSKYSGGIQAAIDDGVVVEMTEDLAEKVPNYTQFMKDNDYIRRALELDDGNFASFCYVQRDMRSAAWAGMAIRGDWLKRVGKEVPTTIDELHDVLVAFKEQDANGNGDAGDELPMSDRVTLNLMKELAPAWGLLYNTMEIDPNTGKVNYWTEVNDGENFRDFVLTMKQWYEEGLIDPEFTINTQTEINSKVTSDQLGFFYCNTNRYPGYEVLLKDAIKDYADSDELELVPLARFEYQYETDGKEKHYTAANGLLNWVATSEASVLTQQAVDDGVADKILDLFNYMYSQEGSDLINWGVEGVSYEVDANGNKVWKEDLMNNDGSLNSDSVLRYCIATRGQFPKIADSEAWMTVDCTGDAAKKALELNMSADLDLLIPKITLTGSDAETYTRIMNDVNTAIAETFLSVIIGNKDESAIDDLYQTLDKLGIQQAIEIYQGIYDNYLAK